jgi:DNA-binding beta-propeller fold protein YncE
MSRNHRFPAVFVLVMLFSLGPAAAAVRPVQEQERAQAGLVAEIEEQLDHCRGLIREGRSFQEALDILSPLTARVFTVTDRSRQMSLAVEIFLLKGIAQSGTGNDSAAVREFRSMFELSPALAREATKNIYDSKLNRLLAQAEGREPEPVAAQEAEKEAPAREAAPSPPVLTLVVTSDPPGAEIFVDGVDSGIATDGEIAGVARVPHTVKLVKDLYAEWSGPVPVPDKGDRAVIAAKLYPSSYVTSGIWGGIESDMFAGPVAIAVSRDGLIWVADSGPVRVRMMNKDGESQTFGGGPEMMAVLRPGGLAVDGSGNVYLSDPEAHAILKFDRSGRFIKTWGQFGAGTAGLNTPLGLAVDGQGMILVADGGNGLVKRFSPDGVLAGSFGQGGQESARLAFPRSVAVTSRGEIAVLDRAQVILYGPDGGRVAAWGREGSGDGEMSEPFGIAVDALDCVYVADSGNHRVLKFDPRGRILCAWGGLGGGPMMMSDPSGVAVDAEGAVIVAERNNRRIQVFTVGVAALGAPQH